MIRTCVVFIVILFLAAFAPGGSAETLSSSWLNSSSPSLKLLKQLESFSEVPAYTYNSCLADTKFVTIHRDLLKGRAEASTTACAVQSAFGLQSVGHNLLQLNNSGLAGTIKDANGSSLTVLPVPNSPHLIYMSGTYDGSYLFQVKDFAANSTAVTTPNGSIYHQLKPGVTGSVLKDASGAPLVFFSNRFADNGKWLAGEVPGRGLTRVNLETGQSMTFGDAYNHWNGLRPQFVTSVTDNGRYVISAEWRYDVLRIYDLSTCIPAADPVKKAACQSRDLLPDLKKLIPGFRSVNHAQFSTDHSLRLYLRYAGPDGADRYAYYLLTAPGEEESSLGYLAMGDSFASGEGIYLYKPGTDIETPFNKCHSSTLAYPYLLRAASPLGQTESIACSGAKLKDIYTAHGTQLYSQTARQSEGKESGAFDSEIYTRFLPGYRPQLEFVERTKPQRATISIGGNDMGFGKILLACIMPGTCFTDSQDRAKLFHTIGSLQDNLAITYRQIKDRAASQSDIYVVGYPSLAVAEGNCALNVHLNKAEIEFSNQLISYLNQVIRAAAAKAGVNYINVEQAFAGYRLCETESTKAAVNGLGLGDDKTASIPLSKNLSLEVYLSGRESYHPNALGHRLYASAIAAATNNFAQPTRPQAAGPALPPAAQPASRIIFDDNASQTILIKNRLSTIKARGFASGIPTKIKLANLVLGSPASDSKGEASLSTTLPADTPAGVHFLRFEGLNGSGENIEVWQLVYVAASESDIDGDGVLNREEKCLLAEAGEIDSDKDGVDDACDARIDEPPTAIKISAAPVNIDKLRTENTSSPAPRLDATDSAAASVPAVLDSVSPRKTAAAPRPGAPERPAPFPKFTLLIPAVLAWAIWQWRKRRRKGTIKLS